MSHLETNSNVIDTQSQQPYSFMDPFTPVIDMPVKIKPMAGEFIDAKQSKKIEQEIFAENQKRIRHMISELVTDDYDEETQGDFLLELSKGLSAYEKRPYHVIDENNGAEFVTDFVDCTSFIRYYEIKPAKKGEEQEPKRVVIELSDQHAIIPIMLKKPTDRKFKNDELVVLLVKSVDKAQMISVRTKALVNPKHFKDEINKLSSAGLNVKERVNGKAYDLLTSLSKITAELKRRGQIEIRKGSVSVGWHIAGDYIKHVAPGNKNYAGTFNPIIEKIGNAKASFDFYRKIVHENPMVAISLAVAIAGLMRGCALPKHETKIFHFHGSSSIGKSLIMRLSAAMIGNPGSDGVLVSNWDASMPALESILLNSNHSFLGLDEIQQMFDKDFSPKTKIMSIANGAGALKSTQTGELRERKAWELNVLSTGNVPIDFVGDSQREAISARVINLDIDQMPIWSFGHNAAKAIEIENFIQENFGHFYEPLIDLITKNRFAYRAKYEEHLKRINELQMWVGPDANALARQSKAWAGVQVGIDVLKEVLSLKEEQVMRAKVQLIRMIEGGFNAIQEMKASVEPDFLNELRGFVTSNINRINVKNITKGVNADNSRTAEWMGQLDSSDYDEWDGNWTGTIFIKESKVRESDLDHYKSMIQKAKKLGFLVTQPSRLSRGELTVSVKGFGDCHKIVIKDKSNVVAGLEAPAVDPVAPVTQVTQVTQVAQVAQAADQVFEEIPW